MLKQTKTEWYREFGHWLSVARVCPCALITGWHLIEAICESHRKLGISPKDAAIQLGYIQVNLGG